jgi:TM2 domain-containing membrane protein YozV
MKALRIFLLVLIIIGIGLLITQKLWVPKLVDHILKSENSSGGK